MNNKAILCYSILFYSIRVSTAAVYACKRQQERELPIEHAINHMFVLQSQPQENKYPLPNS